MPLSRILIPIQSYTDYTPPGSYFDRGIRLMSYTDMSLKYKMINRYNIKKASLPNAFRNEAKSK